MRVKMITLACGPSWSASPGEVIDLPNKVAKELIAGRYAEVATDSKVIAEPEPESVVEDPADEKVLGDQGLEVLAAHDISDRTIAALSATGMTTIGELADEIDEGIDLVEIDTIGEATAVKIKEAVDKLLIGSNG